MTKESMTNKEIAKYYNCSPCPNIEDLNFKITKEELNQVYLLQCQTFNEWFKLGIYNGISFEDYNESLAHFYKVKYKKNVIFKRWIDIFFGRPMKRYGI